MIRLTLFASDGHGIDCVIEAFGPKAIGAFGTKSGPGHYRMERMVHGGSLVVGVSNMTVFPSFEMRF